MGTAILHGWLLACGGYGYAHTHIQQLLPAGYWRSSAYSRLQRLHPKLQLVHVPSSPWHLARTCMRMGHLSAPCVSLLAAHGAAALASCIRTFADSPNTIFPIQTQVGSRSQLQRIADRRWQMQMAAGISSGLLAIAAMAVLHTTHRRKSTAGDSAAVAAQRTAQRQARNLWNQRNKFDGGGESTSAGP